MNRPDVDGVLIVAACAWLLLLPAVRCDQRHHRLPDRLILPALALALIAALASEPARLGAAATVAGGLVLVGRLAALALRRGQDTTLREHPCSFDTVLLAAATAAGFGLASALTLALAQATLSGVLGRPLRLPEPLLLGLTATALLGSWSVEALVHSAQAAGTVALIGAFATHLPQARSTGSEPIALGFGDVKLAATLALLLSPATLLPWLALGLLLALLQGAVLSLARRQRLIPLGPSLYIAAWSLALAPDAQLSGLRAVSF
jgi:leader peptidase (prepilin peptidase)/N-methyltransferase